MSVRYVVWRIAADTLAYEANDMTGKGAEITGGRWNSKGTPLVYASGSQALACLETVVHLGGSNPLPLNRYLVRVDIPISLWNARTIFKGEDHVGWDAEPAGKVSIGWGTNWVSAKSSLIAVVPSVIVPDEQNILINPLHPDVAGLEATKIRKWTYDLRLK